MTEAPDGNRIEILHTIEVGFDEPNQHLGQYDPMAAFEAIAELRLDDWGADWRYEIGPAEPVVYDAETGQYIHRRRIIYTKA